MHSGLSFSSRRVISIGDHWNLSTYHLSGHSISMLDHSNHVLCYSPKVIHPISTIESEDPESAYPTRQQSVTATSLVLYVNRANE
jgi:hypothetical protein